MGAPLLLPLPLPGRDLFAGKVGQNTDQNTGIAQPWIRWFTSVYNALRSIASQSVPFTTTQSGLAAFTPTNGQLVYVSDYHHVLIWTGTGYTWAPGEDGSDYMVEFITGPSPTTGWQLCDGSATTKLNSDGTTSPVVVPVSANFWYRR